MDNGAESYRRFLDGDESAFDEIMKELFRGLVFFVNGYVRDVHTAEDIAIDVFADLIVHKHRYNFRVSLKTYLYMLGRSRALDFMRHRRAAGTVDLSEARDVPDDMRALEDEVIADERLRAVADAVSKLPPDMRDAVHLVYFDDLSYDEAARVMKKTRKQIDNLIYRAKKALREELGEKI